MQKSISDLVMEYFIKHPLQELSHGPVVDWVEKKYVKLYNKKPRDIWRSIRKLYQEGRLIKVRKGIYKYDSTYYSSKELLDFAEETKQAVFKRDNFRCVICNRGVDDGVEICVDHKKPKDRDGDNSIDNGQTLCYEHNLMKKNYSQTEAGKRYFIQLYELAVAVNDEKIINFCRDVFDNYDKHKINGHVKRPNGK